MAWSQQQPLPGMSVANMKGKGKKAKQGVLPGFGGMKRSKPAPVVTEETPAPVKKSLVTKSKGLRAELAAGNRPFFMTPKEIAQNVGMSDAGTQWDSRLGIEKPSWQKEKESRLLNKKLTQAKNNPHYNSHWKPRNGFDAPTLHESLRDTGFKGSFNIQESLNSRPEYRHLDINDQHHRLAALRHINPNQFINVNFQE